MRDQTLPGRFGVGTDTLHAGVRFECHGRRNRNPSCSVCIADTGRIQPVPVPPRPFRMSALLRTSRHAREPRRAATPGTSALTSSSADRPSAFTKSLTASISPPIDARPHPPQQDPDCRPPSTQPGPTREFDRPRHNASETTSTEPGSSAPRQPAPARVSPVS